MNANRLVPLALVVLMMAMESYAGRVRRADAEQRDKGSLLFLYLLMGAGFATTHLHLSAAPSLTAHGAGFALDRALAFAKRARNDIDVALVYDCFSIAMLVNTEDLGFAPKGKAGAAFRSSRFWFRS